MSIVQKDNELECRPITNELHRRTPYQYNEEEPVIATVITHATVSQPIYRKPVSKTPFCFPCCFPCYFPCCLPCWLCGCCLPNQCFR